MANGPGRSAWGEADTRPRGPVGGGGHVVEQGECIESIAAEHGLFWETVWDHPDNAELRRLRGDFNLLLPGDRLFIPDIRPKDDSGVTEQRHRFRRKGVPSKLRIVLEDEDGKPIAEQPYWLEINGEISSGTTDGRGAVEHTISPKARRGKLYVGPRRDLEYSLELGHIDPITEVSGVQARLNNLGFQCGPVDGMLNSVTRATIERFQQEHGLEATGDLSDATRDKLREVYGC